MSVRVMTMRGLSGHSQMAEVLQPHAQHPVGASGALLQQGYNTKEEH
jgi:hypothetical protein